MGGKVKDAFSKVTESMKVGLDPGGLFYQSDDEFFKDYQQKVDFGGYGARPAAEADAAEAAASEQKAAIAEQEKLIEDERKKQEAVTDERAARMGKNQLLSGKETGYAGTTLLGG